MNDKPTASSKESFRVCLETIWPRLAVGIAILALLIIGCICAWKAPHPFAFENRLFALAMTWGPAAAYFFGYFRPFADVVRPDHVTDENLRLQRWSTFARMSTMVAIILNCVGWASIATKHFGSVIPLQQTQASSFINLFVLGTLSARPDLCIIGAILAAGLMTISVVESEQFLGRLVDPMSACPGKDRQVLALVLRIIGRCGDRLIRLLGPKTALVLGAVLLVLSLMEPMGPFEGSGLEVVTGQQHWATAEYTLPETADMILSEAGRCIYLASLGLAVLALGTVAARRHGDRLRKGRSLASVATVIAIFTFCDLTLGVTRMDSTVPPLLNVVVLGLLWLIPIALWIWRARGESARANRTRIGIMVLYLPVVLAGLGLLPLALVLVPGYSCFLLGVEFIALGFLRTRWEATIQPMPLESELQVRQAA
jgi:hypothetical protein